MSPAVATGLTVALTLLAVLASVGGYVAVRRLRWLPRLERQTVVIVTREQTLRGVLIGVYDDVLVLASASVLDERNATPLEGEVIVPKAEVRWLQHITLTAPAEPEVTA